MSDLNSALKCVLNRNRIIFFYTYQCYGLISFNAGDRCDTINVMTSYKSKQKGVSILTLQSF